MEFNASQLVAWLQNPEFIKLLEEAEQSAIDKAVAANMMEQVCSNVDWNKLNESTSWVGLAMLTNAISNLPKDHYLANKVSLGPMVKAVNPLLLQYHVNRIRDAVAAIYTQNYELYTMVGEGGDLEGVTDAGDIIIKVAAYHAAKAAERSAHRRDYNRYNTQGKAAAQNVTIINYGNVKVVAEVSREKDILWKPKPLGKDGISGVDENWLGLPKSWFGQQMVDKNPTSPTYGKTIWMPGIGATFPNGVDPITPKNWRDHWVYDEKLNKMVKLAKPKPNNLGDWTLADLMQYLTETLDKEIPQEGHAQTIDAKTGEISMPQFNSCYDGGTPCYAKGCPTFPGHYNKQGTEGAKVTTPAGDTLIDVEYTEYPIERDKCKDGKWYKCPKCGTGKLKENQLKPFDCATMLLPDGMPADYANVPETAKWAGSALCGSCRNALSKQRKDAITKWQSEQAAKPDTKPADADVTNLPETEPEIPEEFTKQLKEYEGAQLEQMDVLLTAEEELKPVNEAIDGLVKMKKEVPKSFLKQREELRNNITVATGVIAHIQKHIAAVEAKIEAVKNGAASPAKANTQKAVGAPVEYNLDGPKPKELSRKQWKALKTAARKTA